MRKLRQPLLMFTVLFASSCTVRPFNDNFLAYRLDKRLIYPQSIPVNSTLTQIGEGWIIHSSASSMDPAQKVFGYYKSLGEKGWNLNEARFIPGFEEERDGYYFVSFSRREYTYWISIQPRQDTTLISTIYWKGENILTTLWY